MRKISGNYMEAVIILFVLAFGILLNNNTVTVTSIAQEQEQQQITGTIKGVGASDLPEGVCSNFHNPDGLTLNFDASFLVSSDNTKGIVTNGKGILKTTNSGVFAHISITGGDINIGVDPNLYTLKGTAVFQSFSYCNLPFTVDFSIGSTGGTQLKCGNSVLITFESVPLTGSATGNVDCDAIELAPSNSADATTDNSVDTTPPQNVKIISAVDKHGRSITTGATTVASSNPITFELSRPVDIAGVTSLKCSIDRNIRVCPSTGSVGYSNLLPGSHTFVFIAKDAVGNEAFDIFRWAILPDAQ
jgi:hypothetical protein